MRDTYAYGPQRGQYWWGTQGYDMWSMRSDTQHVTYYLGTATIRSDGTNPWVQSNCKHY